MPKTPFEKRRNKQFRSLRPSSIATRLRGYWLTLKLTIALWRGNVDPAKQILFELKRTIRPLPRFAHWFDRLQQERLPRVTFAPTLKDSAHLVADRAVIDDISQRFKLRDRDPGLVQCTGLDDRVFPVLDTCLSDFVRRAFQVSRDRHPDTFADDLRRAISDLDSFQRGLDPNCSSPQTPYIYLTQYLLDQVYRAYLGWFWMYQRGLLSARFSILDLTAGSGGVAIGLALLLQSLSQTIALPELHISYASLDKHESLQYRGLQFWRYFSAEAAAHLRPIGLFFQFHTLDLFAYVDRANRLPDQRFDVLTLSRGFFADTDRHGRSMAIYRQIIRDRLAPQGVVMLIVPWSHLPGRTTDCRLESERELIQRLVELDLGLELEWCRYVTSTGTRGSVEDVQGFARQHCPPQTNISVVARDYLHQSRVSHYAIDDYIILARLT